MRRLYLYCSLDDGEFTWKSIYQFMSDKLALRSNARFVKFIQQTKRQFDLQYATGALKWRADRIRRLVPTLAFRFSSPLGTRRLRVRAVKMLDKSDSQGKKDYNAAIPILDAWSNALKNKDSNKDSYEERVRYRFNTWSDMPGQVKRIVHFLDAASYDDKLPLAVYIDLLYMSMEPLFRANDHRCLEALLKLCLDLPEPFDCLWEFFDMREFVVGQGWDEGDEKYPGGDYFPSARAISQMVRLACEDNNELLAEKLITQLVSPSSFEHNYLVSHFANQGNNDIMAVALSNRLKIPPTAHLANWAALTVHPDAKGVSVGKRQGQLKAVLDYCQENKLVMDGSGVLGAVLATRLDQGLLLLSQYRKYLDFTRTSVADLFVRHQPDVSTAQYVLDLVRPRHEQLEKDWYWLNHIRGHRNSYDGILSSELLRLLNEYQTKMTHEQQHQQQVLPQPQFHVSDPYPPVQAGDRKDDYDSAGLFDDMPPLERGE
jgi:hypothetical protein